MDEKISKLAKYRASGKVAACADADLLLIVLNLFEIECSQTFFFAKELFTYKTILNVTS